MKGDFTRFGFNRSKHFSRVLHQQGRVALDSDANESSEILLNHLRTLTRDLFGDFGGPADSAFAFDVEYSGSGAATLWLSPGHYYVHGILCENEDWTAYTEQPDYIPAPPDANGSGGDALLNWLRQPNVDDKFWLYLDVWERHVTWIEDDSLRESALGGPDTCSRTKVVWQVKALAWDSEHWGSPEATDGCRRPLDALPTMGTGRLAAQLDPGQAVADACVISPSASYRGAGNQLYRVEIHTGGDGTHATFKWSRENGSVATRWLGIGNDAHALVVRNTRGFAAGDWIEITDDALDLAVTPGPLLRVASVAGDQLVVDAASGTPPAWTDTLANPKLRRWDQKENDAQGLIQGAVPVVETPQGSTTRTWIALEDGLQVAFENDHTYRSGDYWVIPARAASTSLDWPQQDDGPVYRAAVGVAHSCAPLGVLGFDGQAFPPHSCRSCAGLQTTTCAVAIHSKPVAQRKTTPVSRTRPAAAPAATAVTAGRAVKRRRTG